MDVFIRGVEFEKPDSGTVIKFLEKNKKTQVVDAKCFHGEKHLIHSILQSLKAFRSGANITNSEELEFLVRFSAQRQIKKALEQCRPAKKSVFICWAENRDEIFSLFKQEFKFREIKLPGADEEWQKAAIERTSTFYLS